MKLVEEERVSQAEPLLGSRRRQASWQDRVSDYFTLTKPRITALAVLTAAAGYLLAGGPLDSGDLAAAVLGTALVVGGANTLNMLMERDRDRRMPRTANRPLPGGRLRPEEALLSGCLLAAGGIACLGMFLPPGTALWAAAAMGVYLLVYTPLKTRSWLSTHVGAVAGAIPPVIGWVAAKGAAEPEAWALFAILYFWQLPHFWALCWVLRDEYAQAGFRMLPSLDPDGGMTSRQILVHSIALVLASALPALCATVPGTYLFAALPLGIVFLGFAIAFCRLHTEKRARRLFGFSLVYLPVLLVLLVASRLLAGE